MIVVRATVVILHQSLNLNIVLNTGKTGPCVQRVRHVSLPKQQPRKDVVLRLVARISWTTLFEAVLTITIHFIVA